MSALRCLGIVLASVLVAQAAPAVARAPGVKPPDPTTRADFKSPARLGVRCAMSDLPGQPRHGGVMCQSVRIKPAPLYMQRATLSAGGRVTICRDRSAPYRCNLGDAGEDEVPTLGYGRQLTVGRFRCRVLRRGVECTLLASGTGFTINRDATRRLG